MLKKHLTSESGIWNVVYLVLFYVSTTLMFIFIYLALHAHRWLNFKIEFLNRSLFSNTSSLGKNFLFLLAVFFIFNTIYLIKKK